MNAPLPPDAPLPPPLWRDVQALLGRLDARQAAWLGAYLHQQQAGHRTAGRAPALTIAFGSETGNSETLAGELQQRLAACGQPSRLLALDALRLPQLAGTHSLLVICSTHGDGEPPANAQQFHAALMGDGASALPDLRYAVLALGDSSYPQFCAVGVALDARLAALGAQRLLPCQLCDVDYDATAQAWMDALQPVLPPPAAAATVAVPAIATGQAQPPAARPGRHAPVDAVVAENTCLTRASRPNAVHHVVLAADTQALGLLPGDAVGILPENPQALVDCVLAHTGLDPQAGVVLKRHGRLPLQQALRTHLDLVIPGPALLQYWATCSAAPALQAAAHGERSQQQAFLASHQVSDILAWPAHRAPQPQAFVDSLRPLQPRLYDVANCTQSLPDELHLTVRHLHYRFGQRWEQGLVSSQLAAIRPGARLRIYPHANVRFRLPVAAGQPLVLLADSTGIAPFRAFLQYQRSLPVPHPCWLLFSEQDFEQDFLYQAEWQRALRDGYLQHMDVAFRGRRGSLRHCLVQQQARLRAWVSEGAHLYLCGDRGVLKHCEPVLEQLLAQASPTLDVLRRTGRVHTNAY